METFKRQNVIMTICRIAQKASKSKDTCTCKQKQKNCEF